MIEKLEYFLALAQEKHFGRAADICAVSQPSLSLGLKQLEETLGVMLVQRGSRFIGLTAEGERTLDWARRIVGDARAMRQDIKALKHGLTGRLRIAVIPAALPHGGGADAAALHAPSRDRIHHPVAAVDRDHLLAGEPRDRRRRHLYRPRAADARDYDPALSRALSTADRGQLGVRTARDRDLGERGRAAALPAHARHAEPAHHRIAAARRGRKSTDHARNRTR